MANRKQDKRKRENMTLREAKEGQTYIIDRIETGDQELEAFLLTLGCYVGESVTVISHFQSSLLIAIKDGRYSINKNLANAIQIRS